MSCTDATICTQCSAHYFVQEDGGCGECDTSCLTCGTSATHCLSCDGLILNPDNTCQAAPPSGYYNDSGVSAACHDSCAECTEAGSNQCTSCNGTLYYDGSGSCVAVCADGYYEGQNNTCGSCNTKCVTCDTESTNCLTCNETSYLFPNDNGTKTCVESCGDGYYLKQDEKICKSKRELNRTLKIPEN